MLFYYTDMRLHDLTSHIVALRLFKHVKRIKQNYGWQHQLWRQTETAALGDIKRMTVFKKNNKICITFCENNEQQCWQYSLLKFYTHFIVFKT
jgi:hypothetical protein